MKRYAVLGLVCFSLSTCMFKSYNQSYEMTIQLVDMDEKPIKDLKVRIRLFVGLGASFDTSSNELRETIITNSEGNATFKYFLNISDSSTDGASFHVDSDSVWMPVAFVVHTVGNENKRKTAKRVLKIQMDKLRDVKVRIQKKSTTPYNLYFYASLTGTNDNLYDSPYAHVEQNHKRIFNLSRQNISLFDTTFTCKAYTKANTNLWLQTTKDSFPQSGGRYVLNVESKFTELTKGSNRDSTFHFIFEK